MINISHIFHTSFSFSCKKDRMSNCFYFSFYFKRLCLLVWLCVVVGGGGGFINYMKEMLKPLILMLFNEISLTAIGTPQPF